MGDTPHEVVAVVGTADAANADQPPGPQHAAVADRVQFAFNGDRFRRTGDLGDEGGDGARGIAIRGFAGSHRPDAFG